MEDFQVKRETVRKNRPASFIRTSLRILLGLTSAAILSGCWWWFYTPPTGGVEVTTTSTLGPMSKTSAVAIADAMLLASLGIDMEHDVQLILTNADNSIVFKADGYNASNRIAYEYTAPTDYYYSDVENSLLSCYYEASLITNYRFGGCFIINLSNGDANSVERVMNDFIGFYTNI
jgi:hypothetical protein